LTKKIVEHCVMIDKLSKEQVEQETRINTLEKKLIIEKDNNRIFKLWEADFLNNNNIDKNSRNKAYFTDRQQQSTNRNNNERSF